MAPLASELASSDRVLSRERILPVDPALVEAFPHGGLLRGTTIGISGTGGASSLALALLAAPLAAGSWGAVVGIPELGVEAAVGAGVPLERLVFVPRPGRGWLDAVATLMDGVDLLFLRPTERIQPSIANKITARGRERGCVLVICAPLAIPTRSARPLWPASYEFTLEVTPCDWEGIGRGFGTLQTRKVAITCSGRRVVSGPRRKTLYLPDRNGGLGRCDEAASLVITHLETTASAS